ncbi:hypothetical protein GC093_17940 [Paenibacillus sp. LMG 31456]|uniref:DUF8042 domain-containing protein n=1 Tax=Paenibacillus foliorum TaxID=2654974 RepID=A0A972GRY6_9BACL|nr:hypothetical protein [Paenibacillus foliorum]NOU95090.1 hypothetical protein [Paenibacillus foliorum]
MERYADVIKQMEPLIVTCSEGIDHISKLIEQGLFEQSIMLFTDVVNAFCEIENALLNMENDLPENLVEGLVNMLNDSIRPVVEAYETSDWNTVQTTIQVQLRPVFIEWKERMNLEVFSSIASQ